MSIYRRKDSPYWWVKLPPILGQPKGLSRSTGTSDKREAEQYEVRLKHERWEQSRLGVKPARTWDEAVVRWLSETEQKATHAEDKSKLRWLDPYLGGKTLGQIDRDLIDRIKMDRAKVGSRSTANRYLALVRSILKAACEEWEWTTSVPKFRLYTEPEGRIRALSDDEYKRLMKQLPEHLRDAAEFSIATGMRQGNVRQLEWKHVDLRLKHAYI